MAIVFMALSCGCWIFGARQFYHLVRIAQMLHLLTFLTTGPKPSRVYAMLENFKYNIFNVIPNPVIISERNEVQCLPGYDFWSEGYSCLAYNTLRNYVLGFIIYVVLYGFLLTNKYHEVGFWFYLKRTMRFTVYMLSIMPDIFLGIYANAVAPLTNSVLSLGFLFSGILLLWYGFFISRYLGLYFNRNQEIVGFLSHYVFSRSDLTMSDKKLGCKVLAVTLENLKILVVVTMIGLFHNSPNTQLVLVMLAFILNALFLVIIRPYTSIWQNLIFALSDTAFFVIVLVLLIYRGNFDTTAAGVREGTYGGIVVAMVWIIFFANLVIFLFPVLKGQDTIEVVPTGETELREREKSGRVARGGTFNDGQDDKSRLDGKRVDQSDDRLVERQSSNLKEKEI